jgi:hypothetical protein
VFLFLKINHALPMINALLVVLQRTNAKKQLANWEVKEIIFANMLPRTDVTTMMHAPLILATLKLENAPILLLALLIAKLLLLLQRKRNAIANLDMHVKL